MNEIYLYIVMIIHFILVLFIIATPFTDSTFLLLMHGMIIPFIILHWLTNNNTCALTITEQFIRYQLYGEIPESGCTFIGQIIDPVYKFTENNKENVAIIYTVTIILWIITMTKLRKKYTSGDLNVYINNFKKLTK